MKKCPTGEETMSTQTKYPTTNNPGKLKQKQEQKNSMPSFLPRKPDEYFLPEQGDWQQQMICEEEQYYDLHQ